MSNPNRNEMSYQSDFLRLSQPAPHQTHIGPTSAQRAALPQFQLQLTGLLSLRCQRQRAQPRDAEHEPPQRLKSGTD